LGYLYEQEGKLDKASAIYSKMTTLFPRSEGGFVALGHIREAQKKPEIAQKLYEQAVVLSSKSLPARQALAALLESQGKTDAAVDQYKALLAEDPGNDEAHALLGQLYLRLKKNAEAIAELG